jgi:hypothetical protein
VTANAEYVRQIEEALRACQKSIGQLRTALLAVEPALDKPFPDDPRWTPWSRFIDRPWRSAATASELARAALVTYVWLCDCGGFEHDITPHETMGCLCSPAHMGHRQTVMHTDVYTNAIANMIVECYELGFEWHLAAAPNKKGNK